ncbi:hypothetical protein ACGFMM_29640 [Streptomyces sp. NPDC048604]|uniref:hypothetical protein n=1 Tax=Streptomyces sp. NPDC048604 TaxID=3365578 RepID=UPI00371C1981
MANHTAPRERDESEITLAELRGDCARMAPHWVTPSDAAPSPVSPALIHRIVVSPASARLADAVIGG